jgi:hypothetical protein
MSSILSYWSWSTCLFCANNMLCFLLWLNSTIGSHIVWYLEHCCFWSRLFWLFRVFFASIYIPRFISLFLWNMKLEFLWALQWNCSLLSVLFKSHQNLFLHLLRWSWDSCPLFCSCTVLYFIDLHMLNHPCISGMTPSWSWYIIFWVHSSRKVFYNFLLCCALTKFWHQSNNGFIEWVWKNSFLFCLME